MILEIESVYGDVLVHGKPLNESELRAKMKEVLSLVNEREFAEAFCMRFGYERIPYTDDAKIDFTIDLDTHMVIKPTYF